MQFRQTCSQRTFRYSNGSAEFRYLLLAVGMHCQALLRTAIDGTFPAYLDAAKLTGAFLGVRTSCASGVTQTAVH